MSNGIQVTKTTLVPAHDADTDWFAAIIKDAIRDDASVVTLPHVQKLMGPHIAKVEVLDNQDDRQAFQVGVYGKGGKATRFLVSVVRIAERS